MSIYTIKARIEIKMIHGFSIIESKDSKRLKDLEELVKDKKSGLKFDSCETYSRDIKGPLEKVKIIRFETDQIIKNEQPHYDKEIDNGDICEIKYKTKFRFRKPYLIELIHIKKI